MLGAQPIDALEAGERIFRQCGQRIVMEGSVIGVSDEIGAACMQSARFDSSKGGHPHLLDDAEASESVVRQAGQTAVAKVSATAN